MKKSRHNKKYIECIGCIIISIIIFFIVLLNFFINSKKNNLNIPIKNVSSFKISAENIFKIQDISKKYNIEFAEILTYYSIENNFFDEKISDDSSMEQTFLLNYDSIKSKYKKKNIEPYYLIIRTLLEEIKSFPVGIENNEKYIYGDSWGAERTYGGKRTHMGTDIMDRENIEGQIPIISMTNGVIENVGWNEKGGYRVGIRTKSGNYYYYAHLDSFFEGIEKGKDILVGDTLGYMGNTGYSKIEGTKGNFPVHLHMGIEINTDLSKEPIWINPYPFLRIIESSQ